MSKFRNRWMVMPAFIALASMLALAVAACGGGDDTPAPTATPRPTSTPVTQTPPDDAMEEESRLVRAFNNLEAVYGLGYLGPYRTSVTNQLGGVEESFFRFENGSALTPELIDSWAITDDGSQFHFTIRRPNGNPIPFQAPIGFENEDFGVLDAREVVEWFNRNNSSTNPNSTYGDRGDLAAIFGWARVVERTGSGYSAVPHIFGFPSNQARPIDIDLDSSVDFVEGYTVSVDLASPVFFCLPISQFGCLSAARGPHKVTTTASLGETWAREHHVGTGPYVQGENCAAGNRCTIHAVDSHWRKAGEVKVIEGVHIAEGSTRIANLKNGTIDLAEVDYKSVGEAISDPNLRFLNTFGSGYVGQSILFPGNLWEEFHTRTGEPLRPWEMGQNHTGTSNIGDFPYDTDYPWIGNPWGHAGEPCQAGTPGRAEPGTIEIRNTETGRVTTQEYEGCGDAPYTDTDNPDGIDDMEQARLVRLALSYAINRPDIITGLLGDSDATPIYSEYMGPQYPGWDASRSTACWHWATGETVSCEGTAQPVPWEIPYDLDKARELLSEAGYSNLADFGTIHLQAYVAEAGEVVLDVANQIISNWQELGLTVESLNEDYGGVISPRMLRREQFLPVIKNGDVHSNVYPYDWPLPVVDTSRSRPGWGVGFESQPGANWAESSLAERDAEVRSQIHDDWVDYSLFWVQYAGVFQVEKGLIVNDKVASWSSPYYQHYANVSQNPEFITLN